MDWRISVGISIIGFVFAYGYAFFFGHNWLGALKESGSSIITLAGAHASHSIVNKYKIMKYENSSHHTKS